MNTPSRVRAARDGRTARTTMVAVALGCAALCAGAATVQVARAATPARLTAQFMPDRLNARTTLEFGFYFSAPPGQVPPPLTQVDLRYPPNLGIGLSGLGLEDCSAAALEAGGPLSCPPDSVMGYGVAYTGIVLGTTPITESAPITIFRAPDQEGRLSVLFYAEGVTPVDTHILFPGVLLPASAPFGGLVSIGVPLVPTLPGAPYISTIHLRATIGPRGVTYYERVGGMTLGYKPRGILLPRRCPPGGFPFSARFTFSDETHASAETKVACPHTRGR